MLRGMWDLLEPGLEPVSLALAGGFLTIAPPGKPMGTIIVVNSRNGNGLIETSFLNYYI